MQKDIADIISRAVNELYPDNKAEIEVDRPDSEFGDYSTNVAFKLAAQLKTPPPQIAEAVAAKLNELKNDSLAGARAAAGFINLTLTSQALVKMINQLPAKNLEAKQIVVEYSDPNPFKVLHGGHLYSSVVGDAIANLLAQAGGVVHRVNFGGDIGRHVAICIWGIINELGGEDVVGLSQIPENERPDWLSARYVEGNKAYEADETVQEKVKELNQQLYDIATQDKHEGPLAELYWTCRQWSYDYFAVFYDSIGVKFEKYYPESQVAELGTQTVKEHTPEVYQESDGAVIFNGQPYGLFANVFINSRGLPTYAAKDVGLIRRKWEDFHYDKSVIITGNEQAAYMQVVLKSIEQFAPELANPTTHLTHGLVKLSGNQKMSSRSGNVITAVDIMSAAQKAVEDKQLNSDPKIVIGAIKYSFVKQSIGGDIIYDPAESVSIEGNSGPYLQYAYARAKSILAKAEAKAAELDPSVDYRALTAELPLLTKLSQFAETIEKAIDELKPHYVAGYLYELAQVFNHFYEDNRVIGGDNESLRLQLVSLYSERLALGLAILGIDVLEKM